MTEHSREEEAIFLAAIERTDDEQRRAFVEQACAGRPRLLERVTELLASHDASKGPLDSPPAGLTAALQQPLSEKPGTRIGPYRLLQQIGEGGFGVVYMAEQVEPIRRKVALKIIKPGMDTKEVIARFEAERQALALMDHPNIAKVLDGGATESGRPFFVMELVRGVPITEFCDANKLPLTERLKLFAAVCGAVQHAHQKGVIHRDLKPSNVMVTLHDGRPVPKVIDFGVSKAVSQQLTQKTLFTAYGQMLGTPAYMSPEQAEMSGLDIDTRTDVYSLGVLLYELLTGATPLEAGRLRGAVYAEVQRMIREEEPPKPSTRLSTLSEATVSVAACRGTDPKKLGALVRGDLDWIVMRALEKERERRYESADSLAKDVERFLNREPVEACPPSLGYKVRSYVRRNKQWLVVAGSIQALLFLGIVVSSVLAVRMLNERDRANSAESLARDRLAEVVREQENTRAALRAANQERNRALEAEREQVARRLEAQQQRENAEHQARIADSRRLAARSRETLLEQPDLSLLLAVEALQSSWRHNQPHVPVAEQTLRDALATVGGTPLNLHGDKTRIVTISPGWIVTADMRATHLFDLSASDPAAVPLHLEGERALSSRGDNWLVTVDREKTVRLRDLASHDATPTTVLPEHPGRLESAMVSPDGRWLVTAVEDAVTRLWKVTEGDSQQEPQVLDGHKLRRIGPNSRWLATEDQRGRVHLWDLAAENPAQGLELEMRGAVGELYCVEFGPKGRWLAAGSKNPKGLAWDKNELRVWDLESERPAQQRLLLTGVYWGRQLFSPDGRWLVLAGVGQWTLWDLREQDPDVSPITLEVPHLGGAATFTPDGNVLMIANRIWNLGDERLAQRPRGSRDEGGERVVMHRADPTLAHHEWPTCSAWDDGMRWVAHALPDKRIGVWDLTRISKDPSPLFDETFTLRGHTDPLSSLEFSLDGRWLVSEGAEGTVRLWDFVRKVPGAAPSVLSGQVALSISPNGQWLVTTRPTSGASLWDLEAADPSLREIPLAGHASVLRQATFSPDSRWLVTVDNHLNMQLWDVTADQPSGGVTLFRSKEEDGQPGAWRLFAMKFSADSRWLYAAPSKEARLWDLSTERPGTRPLVFGGHVRVPTVADVSPNGRWLVTADGTTPRLWDLTAEDPPSRPANLGETPTDLSFAEFDAESRWLITFAHRARAPILWDLTAADPSTAATQLRGHDAAVRSPPMLSPNRRWLATSGKDRSVRVWDLRRPDEIAEPRVLRAGNEAMSLEFSADSRWLLGSNDSLTRIWDLATGDLSAPPVIVDGPLHRISPDSRWFVAGNELWSLSTGPSVMPAAVVRQGLTLSSAEFSPTGRWLAIYSENKAHLFDLSVSNPPEAPILLTGALRTHSQVFPRRRLDLLPMPFTPDGRWLVGCRFTGGQPDTLLINLGIRELVEVARRTAGRGLTEEERKLFLLNDRDDLPSSGDG